MAKHEGIRFPCQGRGKRMLRGWAKSEVEQRSYLEYPNYEKFLVLILDFKAC